MLPFQQKDRKHSTKSSAVSLHQQYLYQKPISFFSFFFILKANQSLWINIQIDSFPVAGQVSSLSSGHQNYMPCSGQSGCRCPALLTVNVSAIIRAVKVTSFICPDKQNKQHFRPPPSPLDVESFNTALKQ